MLLKGAVSGSSRAAIVCNASIVDEGGVFSPKSGLTGGLFGPGVGVGVLALDSRFSGEPVKDVDSDVGVRERLVGRSGDFAPSR